MQVACSCSFPVVSDGIVPYQTAPVGVAVPAQMQPMPQVVLSAGGLQSGSPLDPSMIPSTESERDAVRKALMNVREKTTGTPQGLWPIPSGLSSQAKLMIRVPENAKLWIDEVACPLEGEVRTFTTPKLEPGLEYSYTVRIALERDGRMTTAERMVRFATGQTVEVDFGADATPVVQR